MAPAERRRLIAGGVALAAAVWAVFHAVAGFGLVNYDDHDYIRDNAVIQTLDWNTVLWALTERHESNWNPLAWLSHALDIRLFGSDWGAHHLVNIGIHLLNALLVLWLVHRLVERSKPGSGTVAALVAVALFAVHPVQVESVAWLSSRRTLLCATFSLAAVLAWDGYAVHGSARRWATSFACFLLAIMAKPVAVTLPLVLLLLDHWPYRRLSLHTLVEKLPWFAVSAAVGALTVANNAATKSLVAASLTDRLMAAPYGLLLGLANLSGAAGLSPLYPFGMWQALGTGTRVVSAVLVLLLGVGLVVAMKRAPAAFVAIGSYLVALAPVAIPAAGVAVLTADRYLYTALIGPAALLGVLVADAAKRRPLAAGAVALLALAPLAWTASRQVEIWRDSTTMWTAVLQRVGDAAGARPWVGIGFHALDARDYTTARHACGESLRLQGFKQSLLCLGEAEAGLGRPDLAEAWYRQAAREFDDEEALNTLGVHYLDTRQPDKALPIYRLYVRRWPERPIGYYNLAAAIGMQGDVAAACAHFRTAIARGFKDMDYARKDLPWLGGCG